MYFDDIHLHSVHTSITVYNIWDCLKCVFRCWWTCNDLYMFLIDVHTGVSLQKKLAWCVSVKRLQIDHAGSSVRSLRCAKMLIDLSWCVIDLSICLYVDDALSNLVYTSISVGPRLNVWVCFSHVDWALMIADSFVLIVNCQHATAFDDVLLNFVYENITLDHLSNVSDHYIFTFDNQWLLTGFH